MLHDPIIDPIIWAAHEELMDARMCGQLGQTRRNT